MHLEFSNDRKLQHQESHVLVPFQVRLKRPQHATTRNVDSVVRDPDVEINQDESSLISVQSNDQKMDEENRDV